MLKRDTPRLAPTCRQKTQSQLHAVSTSRTHRVTLPKAWISLLDKVTRLVIQKNDGEVVVSSCICHYITGNAVKDQIPLSEWQSYRSGFLGWR